MVVLSIAMLSACNNNQTSAEKTVDLSAETVIDSLKTNSDSLTKSSHSTSDSAGKPDSLNKK